MEGEERGEDVDVRGWEGSDEEGDNEEEVEEGEGKVDEEKEGLEDKRSRRVLRDG